MAKSGAIAGGIILLILAIAGYFIPISGDGHTAFQDDEICSSGGANQMALAFGLTGIQQACQLAKLITFGIYGSGIIGLILIIVGAVVPSKNRTWICEFCNYAASTEAEMINHKNRKHLEKKSGYICEHCAFIGRTEGELLDHYNDKHPKEKK